MDKFYKRQEKLSPLEEKVAKMILEIENQSSELKKSLQNFLLDSVKEVQVFNSKTQSLKPVIMVTIPYVCHKILARVSKFITVELEKKTKTQVFFSLKRKIDSKFITLNKTQQRPRSHTLSSVFDSILDDLCSPAVIIGKRFRLRQDGSKLFKIILDVKDQDFMVNRLEAIASVYKNIAKRELAFEFRQDHTFYSTKK